MSRAQQNQTFDTASAENKTNESNAQTSESATQTDIANQQSQLAKFAANNPYVEGGQMETTTNRQLAGTADSTAAAAAAQGQQLAQRTGQKASTAGAAGEAAQQAAQRTLGTQEASATQSRLASGADYGKSVLSAGNSITSQQEQLAALQSGAAQGALNTQEQAAQQPSFMDDLGKSLIQGGITAGTTYLGKKG